MASCQIAEFREAQIDDQGRTIPVGKSVLRVQNITYTTAAQSAVFLDKTTFVRIISDAEVYLEFGENPTATASSMRLPQDTIEYFGVKQGDKISAYDGTS